MKLPVNMAPSRAPRILSFFLFLPFVPSTVTALDIVHLQKSPPVPCRILHIGPERVEVEIVREFRGATATAKKAVRRDAVKYFDFEPEPGEEDLLDAPGPDDADALRALWATKRERIGYPNSNAGDVGLTYANALLQQDDDSSSRRALVLFKEIEKDDWNPSNRARARQGRLRAMIRLGQAEAAVQEALELAGKSEDPRVLIEAKLVLAQAEARKLAKIVEENPRWDEDDEVRPERDRLFNAALDLYLFPYLFYGSETEASARGLWGASRIHQAAGDAKNARSCAEDIVFLYPDTAAARQAGAFLKATEKKNPGPTPNRPPAP